MTPFTSAPEALSRARLMLEHGPIVVISDFDGTLARLSPDPWGARILPTARQALRRLSGRLDVRVVFLSGRAVLDLAARVRVGGATYLGDHGAERGFLERGFRSVSPRVERAPASAHEVAAAKALADEVPRHVPEAWLVVERKMPALCFHFRSAPDIDAARERVEAAVERVDPGGVLARSGGRRWLELRPHGAATKADAMRQLLADLRPAAVFALGDDVHDAEAFAALAEAREAGRTRGLAIAVASHAEWVPQVAPFADLILPHATHAARFLAGLARALERGHAGPRG